MHPEMHLQHIGETPKNLGNYEFRVRGPPWRRYIVRLKKKRPGDEMKRSEVLQVIQLEDLHKLEQS